MYQSIATPRAADRPSHPGMVTFVAADGEESVERAEHLPDWLKYAPTAEGGVAPVVRVERVVTDRGFCLRSYSADGRLLWVGVTPPAVPAPRPAPAAAPRPSAAATGWF